MVPMPEHADRDRAAADEQRIGALLRAVDAPAPAALQRRIGELAAGRRARSPWRGPAFGLAVMAAATVVLAIVLSSGPPVPTLTLVRVAAAALASPSSPAPRSLHAAGTAIVFPQWSARGWPSTGVRSAQIGGRAVTTEFYSSYGNGTIGYAIVSGAPLRWRAGALGVVRAGTTFELLSSDGARVVAWVQDGHSCVLASRTASSATMLALAAAQYRAAPV